MDGVVALVALAVFVGVWWWLAKQMRTSGKGFFYRHILGCMGGWMAGLLLAGSAVSMGIIDAKPDGVSDAPSSKPAFKYEIVKDEHRDGRPRKVEVVLSRRISDSELAEVAAVIRDESDATAEKTFIGFRVEGQTHSTYWANAIFNPEYSSSLFGVSAADYEKLRAIDLSSYTTKLGAWLRDSGFESVMVLYTKGEKYFIDSIFSDGGKNTREYIAKHLSDGSLWLELPENDHNEHYIIDSTGALQGWGENGVYMTLPPMPPTGTAATATDKAENKST
ncbi:zinc ribbon domain-containing protein [Pseudomonas aeruginosa]